MTLAGYDAARGPITDASGCLALVSDAAEVAAAWSFAKILEHWSRKHPRAVYVPSRCRTEPHRQYAYGHKVWRAEGTDALRWLAALAKGAVYYDPGIKLEHASTDLELKRRSQFRVASGQIGTLYERVETVEL